MLESLSYAKEPEKHLIPIIGDTFERSSHSTADLKDMSNITGSVEATTRMMWDKKTTKVGESSSLEIAKTVASLREDICHALKKGDSFKFLMNWDASAKVWGLGISGGTGIEVNIRC